MSASRVHLCSGVTGLLLAALAICMMASIPLADGERPDPATIMQPQADLDLAVAIDAKCSGYIRYDDGSPFPDMPVYSSHLYGTDSTTSRWDGYYTLDLPWESDYTIFADKPGWQLSSYVQLKWWEIYDGARYGWNPTATWKGLIIGGHLMDVRGAPLVGVEVGLSGDGEGLDITDANGNYDLRRYDPGSYTVTPTAAGWAFSPSSRQITLMASHKRSEDFIGRRSPKHVAVKHGEPGLVSFDILPPETGTVTVRIISPRGRVVWQTDRFVDSQKEATIEWPGLDKAGRKVASGVYIAAINGAGCRSAEKVVILR